MRKLIYRDDIALAMELKSSYFELAKRNMMSAKESQYDIFGGAA